jgi:hypothetical protein
LKEDDVITAINNVPIADDGTIYFRRGETLSFSYLEKLQFVDDTVTFTIIRQGKRDRKYTFTRIRSIDP